MESSWKTLQAGFHLLELASDWLTYQQFKILHRGRMGHGAISIDNKTFVIGGKTEGNT